MVPSISLKVKPARSELKIAAIADDGWIGLNNDRMRGHSTRIREMMIKSRFSLVDMGFIVSVSF
jgi:hypothetical protein